MKLTRGLTGNTTTLAELSRIRREAYEGVPEAMFWTEELVLEDIVEL